MISGHAGNHYWPERTSSQSTGSTSFFAGPKPLVKSFHEQRLEELRKGKQKLSAPL